MNKSKLHNFIAHFLLEIFFKSCKASFQPLQTYLPQPSLSCFQNPQIKSNLYHFFTLFFPFTLIILLLTPLFAWILLFFLSFLASAFFLALYLRFVLLIQSFPCIFSFTLSSFSVKYLRIFTICLSDLYISTK